MGIKLGICFDISQHPSFGRWSCRDEFILTSFCSLFDFGRLAHVADGGLDPRQG